MPKKNLKDKLQKQDISKKELLVVYGSIAAMLLMFFSSVINTIINENTGITGLAIVEKELSKIKYAEYNAVSFFTVLMLSVLTFMLGFQFFNKPCPLPAPPAIAKKEKILIAKKEYEQLKEDDELFNV